MFPTMVAGKLKFVGDSVIGQYPTAARLNVCTVAPDAALSVTVTEPRIDPPVVGVSDTVNPHLVFAGSTNPEVHGLAPEGFTLYSPDAFKLEIVSAAPLAFNICTDALLVAPIALLVKFNDVGEKISGFDDAPPVAVPVKFTACGLNGTPVAVSLTARPPLIVPLNPFVVGLNVTLKVHADEALSVLPHGFVPPATAE